MKTQMLSQIQILISIIATIQKKLSRQYQNSAGERRVAITLVFM